MTELKKEMNMEIRKLEKKECAGRRFTVRYQTTGYYEIREVESGFSVEYQHFEAPVEKSFEDEFFGEWLENPVVYGAFDGERLLGFVEGALESWNNRYRISNICVCDTEQRHHGIGTVLMNQILQDAKESGARMVVLETQTCNENAIAFYRKNGFKIIGFDLSAYSNTDQEQCEVRIEMGRKLK